MPISGFRMSEDEAWRFVAEAHKSVVTTLRRDGRPVAVPVWHVLRDRELFVKTPLRTKKLARIRNDPRAHVLVESGLAWKDLQTVSFEAQASLVDDAEPYLQAIAEKYAGFETDAAQMPGPVQEFYSAITVVRLRPVGRLHSFRNAALLR